jgi:hypothetical protein
VDTIVWATGYRSSLPVLDSEATPLGDGVTRLYLNVFPRGIRNLFVVGLFETDGAAYPIVSKQAALVAAVIRASENDPERARWFEQRENGPPPKLNGGVHYVASPRHSIYVQFDEYTHVLERLIRRMAH